MELDVRIDNDSLSITIDNPFHLDLDAVVGRIEAFIASKGTSLNGADLRGLLPRMVKGIVGCEGGCPADAKDLVSRGFQNFQMEYIEGGILSAKTTAQNGKLVLVRMFPEF